MGNGMCGKTINDFKTEVKCKFEIFKIYSIETKQTPQVNKKFNSQLSTVFYLGTSHGTWELKNRTQSEPCPQQAKRRNLGTLGCCSFHPLHVDLQENVYLFYIHLISREIFD